MDITSGELSTLLSGPFKEVTWKIPNFLNVMPMNNYCVQSPEFSLTDATWCLQIYKYSSESTWYVRFVLKRLHSSFSEHKIGYNTQAITSLWFLPCNMYMHSEHNFNSQSCTSGPHCSRSWYNIKEYLSNGDGVLTAFCHMQVKAASSVDVSSETEAVQDPPHLPGPSIREDEVEEESPERYTRMGYISGEVSGSFKNVTWKIPNFLDLPAGKNCYVKSPEFFFADATWRLILRKNEPEEYFSGHLDIMLERLRSPLPEHKIFGAFGLMCSNSKISSLGGEKEFTFNSKLCKQNVFHNILSQIENESYLPDGVLTVFGNVLFRERASVDESSQTEEEKASLYLPGSSIRQDALQEQSPGIKNVQLDYKKLLKNGEESDVCFVVSGKEFRAHRCILRARSPAFDAMFHHETEEKSGKVVIEDLDPGSFMDFLEHLYTGRVEVISDENVFGLYTAADKYDAQTLKSDCREYMQRTLSVDTFCDVMTLALRYQDKELMELAVHFFKNNLTKIIVTVKWQIFLSDNSTRANELFIKALVPEGKNNEQFM